MAVGSITRKTAKEPWSSEPDQNTSDNLKTGSDMETAFTCMISIILNIGMKESGGITSKMDKVPIVGAMDRVMSVSLMTDFLTATEL